MIPVASEPKDLKTICVFGGLFDLTRSCLQFCKDSVALSLTKEHQKRDPAHFLFLGDLRHLQEREFLRDAFDFKKARRYLILNNLFFFFCAQPKQDDSNREGWLP